MRTGRLPIVFLVVVALASIGVSASAAAPESGSGVASRAAPTAADAAARVIVKYETGVTTAAARAHARGIGATVKTQIVGPAVPHGRLAVVCSDTLTTQQLVARFKADPRVEYVEADHIVSTCAIPNDTRFWELWGMQQISAPKAWDVQKGTTGIVVADIDSGVAYTHPDLWYNAYYNNAEFDGTAGVDDDGNGYADDFWGWDAIGNDGRPWDENHHGTHTAGTMAGRGNNAAGVTGVCWYAKVMACRFLDSTGHGWVSDSIECINYVIAQKQHGVNVVAINASYGSSGYLTSERNAINSASTAGIVFVAAAGNDGVSNDYTPTYPSNYDVANVISVAAVDWHNNLAFFSNYGATTVDLAAPGVDILSTVPNAYDPSGYANLSGTSMAAPHVTGAIALCAAAYPSESMAQRMARVLTNTDAVSSLSGRVRTGAVLDVAKALGQSGPSSADIPGVNMPRSYTTGSLNEANPDTVYRVFLTGGDQMSARIGAVAGTQYDLYLFGPGTTTVADKGTALASATGGANPKELTCTVPTRGVYYLDVSRVSGSGGFNIACNSRDDDIPGLPFPSGDVIPWIDSRSVFDTVRHVDLAYGERLTTSIVSPPAGSDMRLFLFPPGQFSVWLSGQVASATSGGYPRTIEYPCWRSGPYYVCAGAYVGGGWFTLTHSVAPVGDNDIPGTDAPGSGYSGIVSRTEDRDDVFVVWLFPHQTLTASVTGDAGVDCDLLLYDPAATTVEGHAGALTGSSTGAYPETITYTTPSGPGGPYEFATAHYLDLYAASGAGAYTLTYSTVYDRTAPVTAAEGLQPSATTGWQATSQVVTLTPSDSGGSGLFETRYGFDGTVYVYAGSFTVSGSGSHAIGYWSVDRAANVEAIQTGYVNIDVSPPETMALGLMDCESWRNSPAEVTLEPYDSQSGVAGTWYALDDDKYQYRDGFVVSKPGQHRVDYWSIDDVGNEEESRIGYVNIDVLPPEVTGAELSPSPAGEWNAGDVVVTVAAKDAGGAGVQKTQYAAHGSGAWTDTDAGRFTVAGPADHGNDGTHVYGCRALDRAGNIGSVLSVSVRIDTAAPRTEAEVPPGKPRTVTLYPTDPLAPDLTCSGVAEDGSQTWLRVDGGEWRNGLSVTLRRPIRHKRPGYGPGDHLVEYYSVDGAGNVEEIGGLTITLP